MPKTAVSFVAAVSAGQARSMRLPDQLYDQLIRHIAGQRLQPGSRLPSESDLVQTFKVSRQVIREAFARLQAEGLVVTRQGSGSYLTDRSADRLREPVPAGLVTARRFEFRRALEGEAAALAAQRWGEMDRIELEQQVGNTGHHAPADRGFHLAVARASGNPLFVDGLATIVDAPDAEDGAWQAPGQPPATAQAPPHVIEHRAILGAILARDPEAARHAMRLHLDKVQARALSKEDPGPGCGSLPIR